MLDDVCTHVTSSAASRDVLSNQRLILGCTLKLASNFSIAYTVCKKSAKYGDAFSKPSSILTMNRLKSPPPLELLSRIPFVSLFVFFAEFVLNSLKLHCFDLKHNITIRHLHPSFPVQIYNNKLSGILWD